LPGLVAVRRVKVSSCPRRISTCSTSLLPHCLHRARRGCETVPQPVQRYAGRLTMIRPPKDRDYLAAAETGDVARKSDPGLDLPRAPSPLELLGNLGNLRHAGRSQ